MYEEHLDKIITAESMTGISGSDEMGDYHLIASLHSRWCGLCHLSFLRNGVVWIGMSHEIWKNVTEPHKVGQLTTSCVCDHRVTVPEGASEAAAECVPLFVREQDPLLLSPAQEKLIAFLLLVIGNASDIDV